MQKNTPRKNDTRRYTYHHLATIFIFLFDLDAQNHTVIGRILTLFTRHQRQFITTLLVGNNIALVIFGISIATLTRPLIAGLWDQSLFIRL